MELYNCVPFGNKPLSADLHMIDTWSIRTHKMAALREKEKVLHEEIEKFKSIQKGKRNTAHFFILVVRYTEVRIEKEATRRTSIREYYSQRS